MGKSGLPEPGVATIGDSTFFHAGDSTSLNMVHNKGIGTVILMDKQHDCHDQAIKTIRGSVSTLMGEKVKKVDLYELVKAIGVEKILKVNAFDVKAMEIALKECNLLQGNGCSHR